MLRELTRGTAGWLRREIRQNELAAKLARIRGEFEGNDEAQILPPVTHSGEQLSDVDEILVELKE